MTRLPPEFDGHAAECRDKKGDERPQYGAARATHGKRAVSVTATCLQKYLGMLKHDLEKCVAVFRKDHA